ncbi:MAG: DUF1116 domain-containing protein [Myxococcales bacterium]|nr:DUF1116 domain-containing protein [Myxococcales bacterium]
MRLGEKIDRANAEAVSKMLASRPVWVDVRPLKEVVTLPGARTLTHSGPPVSLGAMSGAQFGACIAAAVFEGWAPNAEEAEFYYDEPGELYIHTNHSLGGVGPMAGVATPNMPVFVIEERGEGPRKGALAYACLEEPRMNFGGFDDEALRIRRAWRDELGPLLGAAVRASGGIALDDIMARALHRGDELHNRPAAATQLMLGALLPALVRLDAARDAVVRAIEWIRDDEIFFLSLAMGAAKLIADAGRGVEDSTLVVAMARNGTEFGIQLSGTGDRWFTAKSPEVKGLFLPGYGTADAGLDMGDSAITETVGLGAFVLQGAPAITEMLGITVADAARISALMRKITVSSHPRFTTPALDFRGAPFGIDLRKVLDTNITPFIDTAIAHKEPGHPVLGAGLVEAPLECFTKAALAFGKDREIV